MTTFNLIFWEPCASLHKLDLFRHLATYPEISLTIIVETILPPENQLPKGWIEDWNFDHFDNVKTFVKPNTQEIYHLVQQAPCDTIHIFSGLHWIPCIVEGLKIVIQLKRHFGLFSEPRSGEGIKGLFQYIHSWLTEGNLRKKTDFFLAVGAHGRHWFKSVGYMDKKIFPFAYFLPEISLTSNIVQGSQKINIAFLGRLEEVKGIHYFIDSLPYIKHQVNIHIAGKGGYMNTCQVLANSHKNIFFHGPIKVSAVPNFLSQMDILVLPSITKNDGWGAVVSEALLAGVAVICSNKVGASLCIDNVWRGKVICAKSKYAIAKAVDDLIKMNILTAQFREKRIIWAQNHLTGKVGANYLLNILKHIYYTKPLPKPFYCD